MASSDGLTTTFFGVEAGRGAVAAAFFAAAFFALAGEVFFAGVAAAFFTAGFAGTSASEAVDFAVLVEVFLAAMLDEG